MSLFIASKSVPHAAPSGNPQRLAPKPSFVSPPARSGRVSPRPSAPSAKRRFNFGKIITSTGLAEFTRQLSTLVNAGMPILRSLETLARQEPNPAFQSVITEIAESIRSGGTLSDGMSQHPRVFDRLYINMVKAGEASGALGTILDRLATFMEKAERIRGKVKAAMAYPIAILCVAVVIVSALMVFVIPRFQEVFTGLLKGTPLPMLTQLVIGTSSYIQHHILQTIGLLALAVAAFKLFARTTAGRSILDRIEIKMPVFGKLFLKAAISRFTRTLGTLLASGVPVLHALTIARDTSGNVHIAAALNHVHDRVEEGDGIGGPLAATKTFPAMVSSMVEIGEETGALPDMLLRVADTYEGAVDNAVNSITSIIEPIMIVLMAFVVGTIVIALFLPLVKIIVILTGS
jgi:type IV pilus assembly protein PilC